MSLATDHQELSHGSAALHEGAEAGRRSHFWRHFAHMSIVMVLGMVASGAILVVLHGYRDWSTETARHPQEALLGMAIGMTLPMAGWMLYRGMGMRNSIEMAAAMAFPVIPFLCLVWFGVTRSALCGVYCPITFVAMLGLMLYRRAEYSMEM